MNLDQIVSMGFRPWTPSKDAVDLEVWHEDDVPTIGTFSVHGTHVLFNLVGEPEKGLTTWAYLPLTDQEFRELDDVEYDSPAEMADDVASRFRDRPCVFAVAQDFKVLSWGPSETGAPSLLAGATDFLRDYVSITQDKIAQMRRQVADLHTAASDRTDDLVQIHVDLAAVFDHLDVSVFRRPHYERPTIPSDPEAQMREYEAIRESLADA